MMDFKPGDLILVRGNDGISHEIETITHSHYSHVAIYIQPGELIEAQVFRKTGYQALDAYQGCSDVYRCDLLTDEQRERIVANAKYQIGTRYDYLLILWELIRYVFRFQFPWNEGNSLICSTLANGVYKSAGVILLPGVEYPSPGDLAQSKLLQKIGSY